MKFDKSWTLFLDRDGVINEKIEKDYVREWSQFNFIKDSANAIADLTKIFGKIIVVTNQQGIGKGLMSQHDLYEIHQLMKEEIVKEGGLITSIYHSPYLDKEKRLCRKPGIGMALKAKKDHPDIVFRKSIMVGDSLHDMDFGKQLKMQYYFITNNFEKYKDSELVCFENLKKFAEFIQSKNQ